MEDSLHRMATLQIGVIVCQSSPGKMLAAFLSRYDLARQEEADLSNEVEPLIVIQTI